MREVVVTTPEECPFRYYVDGAGWCICGYVGHIDHNVLCDHDYDFSPDCPLFENDYLIKRRCNDTAENANKKGK